MCYGPYSSCVLVLVIYPLAQQYEMEYFIQAVAFHLPTNHQGQADDAFLIKVITYRQFRMTP